MAVRWVRLVAVSAALVLFSSGCWAQYRGDAGHSGNQPLEFLIARGNVSTLDKAWSGPTGGAAETAPTVVAGVVYVGAADAKLYAFDAGGAGCSGSPASCPPLWTAALPSGQAPRTSPAVANGVVYVQDRDKVLGFDAAGTTNCSGIPKTCGRIWESSSIGDVVSSPTTVNGKIYTTSVTGLKVFDALGGTNCSGTLPKVCSPIWASTAFTPTRDAAPGVVADRVFVTGDGRLYSFDAAGCGAAVCAPLWRAESVDSAPVIVDGEVFVASRALGIGVFDAAGVTNCSGSPKVCAPLRTTSVSMGSSGGLEPPAVANGVVYVVLGGSLYAFDLKGTTCWGTPKQCTPLWQSSTTAAGDAVTGAPAVANGVVYVGGEKRLRGYDGTGRLNCAALPKRCDPLWTTATTTGYASPVILNGTIYAGAALGLDAFKLSGRALAPSITGIKPQPVVGQTISVTVTGTGFVAGLGVATTIPGAVLGSPVVVSAASMSVPVTVPGTGTPPGQYVLRVTNADQGLAAWTILVQASSTQSPIATNAGIAAYPGILWECPAERDADLQAIADAGAQWTMLDLDWKSIQASPTDFGWTRGVCNNGGYDAAVMSARAKGLKVLATVTYSPPWARDTTQPGCEDLGSDDVGHCFPTASHVSDYATFAGAAAARYGPNATIPALKNSISSWQLWNEPNHQEFSLPRPDPDRYAAMVKAAYAAIKAPSANPTATIITGGTAPTSDDWVGTPPPVALQGQCPVGAAPQNEYRPLTWLRCLYARGAGTSFDAVGHHPYNFPCSPLMDHPLNAFRQTGDLYQEMTLQGDSAKKVWGTEMGASTGTDLPDDSNICAARAMTEAEQAQSVFDYYKGWNSKTFSALPDFSTFTGPLIWKAARDGTSDPSFWWNNQGLLYFDPSLAPKPAFTMFQQVTSNGFP